MTQFFADDPTEIIYQERTTVYSELLKVLYPDFYNWDLHATMTREMVRREMEIEILDRLINNDMDNAYIVRRRTDVDRMLSGYRDRLGISLPVMKRLKASHTAKQADTLEEGLGKMMAKFA